MNAIAVPLREYWGDNRRRAGLPGLGGSRKLEGYDLDDREQDARRVARQKYYQAKDIWDVEVRKAQWLLYQADLREQRRFAEQKAEEAVDIDLTVLRGRTPAFILEFTAIVIIIFTAMSLGILDILKNEQIGTLLAAIAGYVLGRSTTGGSGASQKNRANAPAINSEGEPGATGQTA